MLPAEIEKLLAVLDERERYILTLRFDWTGRSSARPTRSASWST